MAGLIDADMDYQYDATRWSTRSPPEDVIPKHTEFIEKYLYVYEKIPHVTLTYGSTERQKVDVFLPDNFSAGSPVLVHIHGGKWQESSRQLAGLFAQAFVPRGFAVALVGYDLYPTVTLPEIINQIYEAVRRTVKFAEEKKAGAVYVSGHSAGAHIVGMVAFHEESDLIKGYIPISGLFDLTKLQHTTVGESLLADDNVVHDMSPINFLDLFKKNCLNKRFLIIYGEQESPEFFRQSQNLHEEVTKLGIDSKILQLKGVDHLREIEGVTDSSDALHKAMIEFMKY